MSPRTYCKRPCSRPDHMQCRYGKCSKEEVVRAKPRPAIVVPFVSQCFLLAARNQWKSPWQKHTQRGRNCDRSPLTTPQHAANIIVAMPPNRDRSQKSTQPPGKEARGSDPSNAAGRACPFRAHSTSSRPLCQRARVSERSQSMDFRPAHRVRDKIDASSSACIQ